MSKRIPGRSACSIFIIIALLLLWCFPDAAVATRNRQSPRVTQIQNQPWLWTFNTGYRQDSLDWSIAGDTSGNNPNILSELTWTDLEIFQIEGGLERRFRRNFILGGTLAYGLIFDGKVQDSDYLGDNRTMEFSRSNNSADDGDTWDLSVEFGYEFLFGSGTFGLTPLVGYSYHLQKLKMTNGVQTVSEYGFPVPIGPFPGLNSSYDARWHGPWTGLDFDIRVFRKKSAMPRHGFKFGFEYHFYADYYAEADWNLRSDFEHPKSFEHEADGSGVILTGAYNFYFDSRWSLDLNGKYQKWQTDPGTDRVFFADGTQVETRLNEVNWESYSVLLGVTCRF